MANKQYRESKDLDYLNYLLDLWSNFQVYTNRYNILKHWSIDEYEEFIKMYNKVYNEMEALKKDIPKNFGKDTREQLQEYVSLILEYIAKLRHRAISFRAKAQGTAKYGLLADRKHRKENLQTILKIDQLSHQLINYRDKLEESLKYINYLTSDATNLIEIDREDVADFVQVLNVYLDTGKDKALAEFEKMAKKIITRNEYSISIRKISFLTGALNANGIIDETEMENMSREYTSYIRKLMLKK